LGSQSHRVAVRPSAPVDEFAEFELHGLRTLTRDEFRNMCEREKTKEKIVEALRK